MSAHTLTINFEDGYKLKIAGVKYKNVVFTLTADQPMTDLHIVLGDATLQTVIDIATSLWLCEEGIVNHFVYRLNGPYTLTITREEDAVKFSWRHKNGGTTITNTWPISRIREIRDQLATFAKEVLHDERNS